MSKHAHALAQTHVHKHTHKSKSKPKQQPAHVAQFIGLHVSAAQIIAARTGIPAEVILAQSALERNWGRSAKGNAYFGIKGKSPTGKSTIFSTYEVTLAGKRVYRSLLRAKVEIHHTFTHQATAQKVAIGSSHETIFPFVSPAASCVVVDTCRRNKVER